MSDKTKSPYCHELPDTIEAWDALARRIEDLKKRADKIQLSCLMTEEDVAILLSLEPSWLSDRRTAGEPPFYYKLGKGKNSPVRYSLPEVMDYLTLCCRRYSTSDNYLIEEIELTETEYFNKYGRHIGEQQKEKKQQLKYFAHQQSVPQ